MQEKDTIKVIDTAVKKTHLRTVVRSDYGKKQYGNDLKPENVGRIMRMKQHMSKLLANYINDKE